MKLATMSIPRMTKKMYDQLIETFISIDDWEQASDEQLDSAISQVLNHTRAEREKERKEKERNIERKTKQMQPEKTQEKDHFVVIFLNADEVWDSRIH